MAKRNNESNEKKESQLRIWITPELIEKMEKTSEEIGCPSRSEFVRDAIEFYIAYHNQNKNVNFISPIIGSVIKTRSTVQAETSLLCSTKWQLKSHFSQRFLPGMQTLTRMISMKYASCVSTRLQQLTAIFLLKKRGRNTIKNGKDNLHK